MKTKCSLNKDLSSKSEHSVQKDIFAGIVVALVSIPISMGYAQIAGLPPVYGLYGSLLPILIYGLMTSSRQFVVGVDAMPAVMVGALLTRMGIEPQTPEALSAVTIMTFLVALWFVVLFLFRAGKFVKFISSPVMGGFISGVGMTIILMQIPKLFGADPGTGELLELLGHIEEEASKFHPLSAILGVGTVVIILLGKKWIPKIPMTVVMMAVGAFIQYTFGLDRYGVKVMPEVAGGLPPIRIPDFHVMAGFVGDMIMQSLGIAGVIMAQTLLASGNYAAKYKDKLNSNRELISYAAMNIAGGVVGSCPINGSVSRSGIADSLGVRSQAMSYSASATMLFVLLFGTPLFKYLPVPILTGIVISALIGILELKMVRTLWKSSKNEWVIFMMAFLGVLLFGTLYGVVIGVVLSFWEVAIRAVVPPTAFMGRIPGHGNFYSLKRNSEARPIKNTVIYRFSGNLFFANVDRFVKDIESAIVEDTHQVVVDARGIGTLDITAAKELLRFYDDLHARGILFYMTEHDGSLNDQLRNLGAERLIEAGAVRRTITLALRDAGLEKPYSLEGEEAIEVSSEVADDRLSEFEWAFGQEAESKMEQMASTIADKIVSDQELEESILEDEKLRTNWGLLGRFDEDEFWDFMEIRLDELASKGEITPELAERIERHIERRRRLGQQRLKEINPHAVQLLQEHGKVIERYMENRHPEAYERFRSRHIGDDRQS